MIKNLTESLPINDTEPQVLVYLRLSNKHTVKTRISQSMKLPELCQLIESKLRISASDQILFLNGNKYEPAHNSSIRLSENTIIHVYQRSQFVLDADPFQIQFSWYHRNQKIYDQRTLVKRQTTVQLQINDCLKTVEQLRDFSIESISVVWNCQEIDTNCTFQQLGVAKQSGFIIIISEKNRDEESNNKMGECANQAQRRKQGECTKRGQCVTEGECVIQGSCVNQEYEEDNEQQVPLKYLDIQEQLHAYQNTHGVKNSNYSNQQQENICEDSNKGEGEKEKEPQSTGIRKRARDNNYIQWPDKEYSYVSESPGLSFKKKNINVVYKTVGMNSDKNPVWVSDSSSSELNKKELLKAIARKKKSEGSQIDLCGDSLSCREQRNGLSQKEKGELKWEFTKLFHSETISAGARSSLQPPTLSPASFNQDDEEISVNYSQVQNQSKQPKASAWKCLSDGSLRRQHELLSSADKLLIPTKDNDKRKGGKHFIDDD